MATTPQSAKVKQKPGVPGTPVKRRKYAAGDGTPRSRKILLGLIALCVVSVFFLPKTEIMTDDTPKRVAANPNEKPEDTIPIEMRTAPPTAPDDELQLFLKNQPQVPIDEQPPEQLPKVDEVIDLPGSSPEDMTKRIEMLSKYFLPGKPEDRTKAYAALVAMGPELASRLPKLIQNCDNVALAYYADAARQLKADNTAPALIARISDGSKKPIALREMFQALVSFDSSVARDFVFNATRDGQERIRRAAWATIGRGLSPAQADEMLKRILTSPPETFLAAEALGRCGADADRARELSPRIQTALSEAKNPIRLALVIALCGMDQSVSGSTLMSLASDGDWEVRLNVMKALARNPQYRDTILNNMRQEENAVVKTVCIRALAAMKAEEAVPDLIPLLNIDEVRVAAHDALVSIAGKDFGYLDYKWIDWLNNKNAGGEQPPAQ